MTSSLGCAERIAFSLRDLYGRYGYRQYKMSKFEEYDLYARNKDFLISDSVITFTDLGGKLMALKPDVTLSIVKNSTDRPGVRKLYYHENVYRINKGDHGYREIMQVGLEAIGQVDDYTISEVLLLAAKSLSSISENAVLDVSHLGILTELMEALGIPSDSRSSLVKFISEKNTHEMTDLCRSCGICDEDIDLLRRLIALKGTPATVLPQLESLLAGKVDANSLTQFRCVLSSLDGSGVEDLLRIDFSVVDDLHYYNGFIFKGFVQGLPGSVLSGGQYDRLMTKMKRTDRAIGFAVYTDLLEQLEQPSEDFDVDVVLVYDDSASLADIRTHARLLSQQGRSVMVLPEIPQDIRCKKLLKLSGNEVTLLENNA